MASNNNKHESMVWARLCGDNSSLLQAALAGVAEAEPSPFPDGARTWSEGKDRLWAGNLRPSQVLFGPPHSMVARFHEQENQWELHHFL